MQGMVQLAGTGDPQAVAQIGGQTIDGYTFVPLSYIQQFANDPDWVVLVSEIARPGVQLFATKVEHMLFPPDSPTNGYFNLGAYQWDAGMGMPFMVLFFPSIKTEEAKGIARECDLHFTDGVPTIFGDNKMETFPLSGPSVFRMENLPDSKVYAGALNPDGGLQGYQQRMKLLLSEERNKTKEFLRQRGITDEELNAAGFDKQP